MDTMTGPDGARELPIDGGVWGMACLILTAAFVAGVFFGAALCWLCS
jgi:hypothetical protein